MDDKQGARVVLRHATREEWLVTRRRICGASDVPIILGLSQFKKPGTLWAEKCGILAPEPVSRHQRWGILLEPVIALEYARATGRTVIDPGAYTIQVREDYPHIGATVDRFIDGNVPLQIKATAYSQRSAWKNGPPISIEAQMQIEAFVTGSPQSAVVCLIGGNELVYFDVPRSDRFISAALPKILRFVHHVSTATPLEVTP